LNPAEQEGEGAVSAGFLVVAARISNLQLASISHRDEQSGNPQSGVFPQDSQPRALYTWSKNDYSEVVRR